ncbi:glutathione S-transferase [Calycina marina]|uniref:Glutathione S-transferase n=1 Tax=Calycina marina TaxID=1763456 RepID=A0A9P8CIS7_9HELO|nr:glutathione S-transferase [Calycina marina]
MSKPITLYSHATGPNPWKVAMVLEELNVPYDTKFMDFADLKKDPYEQLCVNGRVPAIEDPNTGINIWESGAIVEYLAETYDTKHELSFEKGPEKYQVKQWLHFQMSGQGPYYGQCAWFNKFHPERLAAPTERYDEQVKRVLYVLNKALTGKKYLVGEKCTIADISFVPWNEMLGFILGDKLASWDVEKNYPAYHAWHQSLLARPAVKKTWEAKQKVASGGGQ